MKDEKLAQLEAEYDRYRIGQADELIAYLKAKITQLEVELARVGSTDPTVITTSDTQGSADETW